LSIAVDLNNECPLLILSSPPEAIAVMLDDIRAELGDDQVAFLYAADVWGRVSAVLLECKLAGHSPNLLDAAFLAGVEAQVAPLYRKSHVMEFTRKDLTQVVNHALPAMSEFEAAAIRREMAAA
jgi:hypothetical protein